MNHSISFNELLIINSVAPGPFPIDCFFRSKKEYELCFGEKWHALESNDCWLAIANIISRGEIEVIKKTDNKTSDFLHEKIFLSLTNVGGSVWEKKCRVNWNNYIWIESQSDSEEEINSNKYIFRVINKNLLIEMLRRIKNSKYSSFFSPSDIYFSNSWNWSNWKSFDASYSLAIIVTSGNNFSENLFIVETYLFDLCKSLSAEFKTI